MLFNRTMQHKMQNFKESIGFPTGSNGVSPLTPWCTQLVNNEATRHMCKAEISEACAVRKNAKGGPLSKSIPSGQLFPAQFSLFHTNVDAPLS